MVGLGGLEPPTSPLSESRTLMSIQVYIGFSGVAYKSRVVSRVVF